MPDNKQREDNKLSLQTNDESEEEIKSLQKSLALLRRDGEEIKSLQKSLALLRRDLPVIVKTELINYFGTDNEKRLHNDKLSRHRERRF
jgi:hypothetical protein